MPKHKVHWGTAPQTSTLWVNSLSTTSIPAAVRPSQSHLHQRCKEHGLMHQSQRVYVGILPRPTVPGRLDGPARDLCPSCFQPQVSVQQNCIELRALLCVAGSGPIWIWSTSFQCRWQLTSWTAANGPLHVARMGFRRQHSSSHRRFHCRRRTGPRYSWLSEGGEVLSLYTSCRPWVWRN